MVVPTQVGTGQGMVADTGEPGVEGVSDGELAAVLSALAGVRRGDGVAAVGVSAVARRALAAGSGTDLLDAATAPAETAAVVAVGAPDQLDAGRRLLRPGGRLVAISGDEPEARAVATRLGLDFRYAEALGPVVVWSAQAPLHRRG